MGRLNQFMELWETGLSPRGRALVAVAGSWRVLELLSFAWDVRRSVPWSAIVPEHEFYQFHPMLSPLWQLTALGAVIMASYLLWAIKGGRWVWPALIIAPFLNQQGLPLGWGLLALQPLLLLSALRYEWPERKSKTFSLLVFFQLTLIYWGSCFHKDLSVWWSSASALQDALNGDYLPTAFGHALGGALQGTGLAAWLTRSVVVGQFLLPLTFFLPIFTAHGVRVVSVVRSAVIASHVLILLLFHIGPFSLACIGFWLLIRPAKTISAQSPAIFDRTRRALACVAFILWGSGVVAGTWGLYQPQLSRWWISQSWRIMSRPESPGHSIVRMPRVNWALEGKERWEMAAAWALVSKRELRREWLRAACSTTDGSVDILLGNSLSSTMTKDVIVCEH